MAGKQRNSQYLVPEAELIHLDQMLQEQWRLITLIPATKNTQESIRWLARRSLLRNEHLCELCGHHMTVVTFNGLIDGKRWRCPGSCNTTKTIRCGSWFEKVHMSLPKSIMLLYFYHLNLKKDQVARELSISQTTVVDLMNIILEVCEEDLRRHPQQLGGLDEETDLPGKVNHRFLWRKRYRNDQHDFFSHLLACIREQY